MATYWKSLASLSLVFLFIPFDCPAQATDLTPHDGVDPDLLLKAKLGDPAAEFRLATIYRNGDGVPKDQILSASWLRLSAEQGIPNAQYDLGLCYALGKGVPKDDAQAAIWYAKAAEQDQPEALRSLAFLYSEGRGVQRDTRQAFELFSRAANLGDSESQFQVEIGRAHV